MGKRYVVPLVLLVTFITSLVVVLPAYAWQNGNAIRGLGSVTAQQWILDKADDLAGRVDADWLDQSAAFASISWPDTRFQDFRFHFYDRWGERRGGNAPVRIAEVYETVVDALVADDTAKASSAFGVLAHYYTDICEPFHTDNAPIEWRRGLHERYEKQVMRLVNNGGDDGIRRAAAPGPVPDITTSVTQFSIDTASASHADYWGLLRDVDKHGYGKVSATITGTTMERAVQGVAGLIVRAKKDRDKRLGGATPDSDAEPDHDARDHTFAHADADAYSLTDADTDADAYRLTDTDADEHTFADADTDADQHTFAHAGADAHAVADAHTDPYAYADAHTDADAYIDADAHPDADDHVLAVTHPDADPDADADSDPYTDGHAAVERELCHSRGHERERHRHGHHRRQGQGRRHHRRLPCRLVQSRLPDVARRHQPPRRGHRSDEARLLGALRLQRGRQRRHLRLDLGEHRLQLHERRPWHNVHGRTLPRPGRAYLGRRRLWQLGWIRRHFTLQLPRHHLHAR